jgi:hypothetical protein
VLEEITKPADDRVVAPDSAPCLGYINDKQDDDGQYAQSHKEHKQGRHGLQGRGNHGK